MRYALVDQPVVTERCHELRELLRLEPNSAGEVVILQTGT
jgi:hypothetical protein